MLNMQWVKELLALLRAPWLRTMTLLLGTVQHMLHMSQLTAYGATCNMYMLYLPPLCQLRAGKLNMYSCKLDGRPRTSDTCSLASPRTRRELGVNAAG